MENTHYQTSMEISLLRRGCVSPDESLVEGVSIHALSSNTWAYYYNETTRAETVDGGKKFRIKR